MSRRTILSDQDSERTLPARGPFGDDLFVERDALPFGERIEAALHAASMEEPLLSAIVTDEAEAAITHEPFDSAL